MNLGKPKQPRDALNLRSTEDQDSGRARASGSWRDGHLEATAHALCLADSSGRQCGSAENERWDHCWCDSRGHLGEGTKVMRQDRCF